jgi:hypothetical protein
MMRPAREWLAALSFLSLSVVSAAGQTGGIITGKVTFKGNPPKPQLIDMSKEPECVKLNPKQRTTEDTVTGPGDTLKNVVVFISLGASVSSSAPPTPVNLNQQNGHYTTRVLAFQVGQDVKIINSDPLSHTRYLVDAQSPLEPNLGPRDYGRGIVIIVASSPLAGQPARSILSTAEPRPDLA